MEAKTLREICASTGASRRAVQGYEKAGLVSPTGKNKYGYLLYDNRVEERIGQIRFYQQLGFSVREITGVIDAANPVKRAALQAQILKLEKERENLDNLIRRATELLDSLV